MQGNVDVLWKYTQPPVALTLQRRKEFKARFYGRSYCGSATMGVVDIERSRPIEFQSIYYPVSRLLKGRSLVLVFSKCSVNQPQ
jgi:hypothetical protein